jgi:hypothetical protein
MSTTQISNDRSDTKLEAIVVAIRYLWDEEIETGSH